MTNELSINYESDFVKTNPVWAYREFIRRNSKDKHSRELQQCLANWIRECQAFDVRFPDHLRREWKDFFCHVPEPNYIPTQDRPGVIGLLRGEKADLERPTGFVTQIIAEDSSYGWKAMNTPFHADEIESAFWKLLRLAGLDLDNAIPEARTFSIRCTLKHPSIGRSMNIAALVAVIDAWNDRGVGLPNESDLLRCCISLVKPKGDALVSVDAIDKKLEAFQREYVQGSLVICTSETAEKHMAIGCFANVWIVDSFADLAEKLLSSKLLSKLVIQRPISLQVVDEVTRMIQRARHSGDDKLNALGFANRFERVVEQGNYTTIRVPQKTYELLENLHRDMGNFADACSYSHRAVRSLEQLSEYTSFQEKANAKTRLAAALYDSHRFFQGIDYLREYVDKALRNPELMSPESRVSLFNTQARLLSAVGEPDWEPLFEKSLKLQQIVDPLGEGRTRCYLLHANLRNRSVADARKAIEWFEQNSIPKVTESYLLFYRAEVYRRDPTCDISYRQNEQFERTGHGDAFAFYLQATARQPDRSDSDRRSRLLRSKEVMLKSGGNQSKNNLLRLYSLFIELTLDDCQETKVREEIDQILASDEEGGLRDWYGSVLANAKNDPEQLFLRIPHF
jgi:hypothetical protein